MSIDGYLTKIGRFPANFATSSASRVCDEKKNTTKTPSIEWKLPEWWKNKKIKSKGEILGVFFAGEPRFSLKSQFESIVKCIVELATVRLLCFCVKFEWKSRVCFRIHTQRPQLTWSTLFFFKTSTYFSPLLSGFLFIFSLPFYKKVPRSALGLFGAAYKGFIGIVGWDIGELMRTRLSDRHIKLTIIDLFFLSAFFFSLVVYSEDFVRWWDFFLFVFSTELCVRFSHDEMFVVVVGGEEFCLFCMEPSGLSLSTNIHDGPREYREQFASETEKKR